MSEITALQAAKKLGTSTIGLKTLEKQGVLRAVRERKLKSFYNAEEIEKIKSRKSDSVENAAEIVRVGMQTEMHSSISNGRKILLLLGGLLSIYLIALGIITTLLVRNPLETARWLGIIKIETPPPLLALENQQVLAATTDQTTPLQSILQPLAKTSIEIVKTINPASYDQIAEQTILNPNDIFAVSGDSITPRLHLNVDVSPGPAGLTGPTGPPGLSTTTTIVTNNNKGDKGDTGEKGNTGDTGAMGATGAAGLTLLTTCSDTQVLAWEASSSSWICSTISGGTLTSLVFSGLTSATNTLASMLIGSGASLNFTGTGTINASNINSATLGLTTATLGNLLIADGTSWVTKSLSGGATLSSTGALTLNYSSQLSTASQSGFLSASDWSTFNNKQISLGFNPENVANKSTNTSLGTSDTLYPSQNAVKTYIDNNALGLNWKTSLHAVNLIAESITPIPSAVEGDSYIINTGGNTGIWSAFLPGDLIQYQNGAWNKLATLTIGDRLGISMTHATLASGIFAGFDNSVAIVSGGIPGAYTYTFVSPSSGDARFVDNSASIYYGISFTYSGSLSQWVQLSSSVNASYGSGLQSVSNIISLGNLTANWNQMGLFAINTAGNVSTTGTGTVTSAGLLTGSNGLTISTGTVTLPTGSIANTALTNSSLTISAGVGLTGGGIVSLGGSIGISLSATGSAGTYGGASSIPIFTTDIYGRVISVIPTTISGLSPTNFSSANISQWTNNSGYIADGNTGWDNLYDFATSTGSAILTNKTISGLSNTLTNIDNGSLTNSSLTVSAGVGLTGGGLVSLGGTTTLSLPSTGSAGINGSALNIPVFTTDAQGRVTAVINTAISGLTTSNLSATAGILNAQLANSTITVTPTVGTGISISGSPFSLGGTLTIAGIDATTAIKGVASFNSTNFSVTSGAVNTIQGISSAASPTFTGLNLSGLTVSAGIYTDASKNLTSTAPTSGILGYWSRTGTTLSPATATDGLTISGTANIGSGTGVVTINSSGTLNLTAATASTFTLANVVNALNFDANTLTIDALNNRVGLGTTAPSTRLSVLGNSSTGNITSITNLNSTDNTTSSVLRLGIGITSVNTNQPRFIQFYQSATTDSNGTGVGYIRLNNGGLSLVSGNADFAEWTEVVDDTVVAGDIISSKSSGNDRAITGDLLLGVVSDSAIIIGNEQTNNSGKAIIGFLGRISTKVSTTNGNIAIGDPITASSVDGVGMKQTKAGPTIGKALAAYSGVGVGKVTIQVVPGWYDPDALLSPGAFTVSGADILQNGVIVTRAGGFQDIKVKDLTVSNSFSFPISVNGGISNSSGLTLLTTCLTNEILKWSGTAWACATDASGGTPLFSGITTATNTTATMIVGTGASLSFSGTGIINASSLNGAIFAAPGAIGSTTPSTGKFTTLMATGATDLINATASGNITMGGQAQLGRFSADPTTLGNGSMYYNTTSNKFRCYENSAWKNCLGSDIQTVSSIDTSDALTNVTSTQITLTNISITPTTSSGDVYIRGQAQVLSSNNTDQILILSIEDDATCTGSTVPGATVSYTIAQGASTSVTTGVLEVHGIIVNAGASAHSYSLCASTATGDTDIMSYGLYASVIDTGADLAEIYTSNDVSLKAGDVVVFDSTLKSGMKKSEKVYDSKLLGIITTNPGMVIGSVDSEGVRALPVALSGRVPVNVTTENGEIKEGDYLTSSSTPGVAMKATKVGAIIGQAMTSYSGNSVGSVLAFVKNSFNPYYQIAESETKAETISENDILELITRKITEIYQNALEFFGKIIFHNEVNFLSTPTFNKDMAGFAVIKSGSKEVEIKFEKEYVNEPVINISLNIARETSLVDLPDYVVADVNTKGFVIRLNKESGMNLRFSWSALAIDNTVTTTSTPSPTSTPEELPTETPTITPIPSIEQLLIINTPTVSPVPTTEATESSIVL